MRSGIRHGPHDETAACQHEAPAHNSLRFARAYQKRPIRRGAYRRDDGSRDALCISRHALDQGHKCPKLLVFGTYNFIRTCTLFVLCKLLGERGGLCFERRPRGEEPAARNATSYVRRPLSEDNGPAAQLVANRPAREYVNYKQKDDECRECEKASVRVLILSVRVHHRS